MHSLTRCVHHLLGRCGYYDYFPTQPTDALAWHAPQAETDGGLVQVPSLMPPEPPARTFAAVAPKHTGSYEEPAVRYFPLCWNVAASTICLLVALTAQQHGQPRSAV